MSRQPTMLQALLKTSSNRTFSAAGVFRMANSAAAQRPKAAFTFHLAVAPLAVSQQTYLAEHPDPRYSYIATGAFVFDTSEPVTPRILLLQRSASDSMPNRWEVPGGGCDDIDESILHAVARELWEEAGLTATHIGPLVGDAHFFTSRSGKAICKFNFMVEVEKGAEKRLEVKLDPQEHQQFLWASEDEVKVKRVGHVELQFTIRDLEDAVLKSFSHFENRDVDTRHS